jgi:hypothetical protein
VKGNTSLLRCFGVLVLFEVPLLAQVQQATVAQAPPAPAAPALRLDIPHSDNPLNTYRATLVPKPNLANSARIDTLVKDGVLELSLKDAISLALENNLDIAIARYNIPIAAADVLRTQAGGSFRGVNTGVVQGLVAQAPEEHRAARAAQAPALQASFLQHWVQVRQSPRMILH